MFVYTYSFQNMMPTSNTASYIFQQWSLSYYLQFYLCVCVCVSLHEFLCTTCPQEPTVSSKQLWDSLHSELQVVVRLRVGAEKPLRLLCEIWKLS